MSSEPMKNEQQPTNSTPEDNGGQGNAKLFTQEEVNKIVSDRLAKAARNSVPKEQADEREKALKARESRLDCREYVMEKGYPADLLDILDTSDTEKFKSTVDALANRIPAMLVDQAPRPTGKKANVGAKIDETHTCEPLDAQIRDIFTPNK